MYKIIEKNSDILKTNLLFNNLFDHIFTPKNFYIDFLRVNVFTSGTNDQLTLGNPLGTSKRQKILFKGVNNFVTKEVSF